MVTERAFLWLLKMVISSTSSLLRGALVDMLLALLLTHGGSNEKKCRLLSVLQLRPPNVERLHCNHLSEVTFPLPLPLGLLFSLWPSLVISVCLSLIPAPVSPIGCVLFSFLLLIELHQVARFLFLPVLHEWALSFIAPSPLYCLWWLLLSPHLNSFSPTELM